MIDVWTEKHRPDTLSEVVGQENIVDRLEAFVENDEVPHMLFAGPAGTGKTTSAIALAKDLYGDEWKQNFMETNASDERGIDVVREKIKNFARTKSIGADYKIIFLDEADALTSDAQQALRRTMEQFSDNCRFILSCNYSSKIIDPIQSKTISRGWEKTRTSRSLRTQLKPSCVSRKETSEESPIFFRLLRSTTMRLRKRTSTVSRQVYGRTRYGKS
jgi:DNA polymerase III gamma/tau subunit